MTEKSLAPTGADQSMNRTVITVALRDLRRGLRGFWIFLSCLALGVAAITAVTTLSSSILNGIARDGKILLGGELAVGQQFRSLSAEQLDLLRDYSDEISTFIETRTLLRTDDVRKNVLVSLKAVDDIYPLHGAIELDGGSPLSAMIAKHAGLWGAVIDESIAEAGNAAVGDMISLGNERFTVTGLIKNEPDRIGSSEEGFAFWPRVMIHRDALENSGLIAEGSRSFFEYRSNLKQDLDIDDTVNDFIERYPSLEVRDFRNASPDLSDIVNRLNVLLSLAGLTTLLIGGVGVSNAVRAYLDTRLSTIAILKNVGASSNFIFCVYLTQILLLALIGVSLGLAAGYLMIYSTAFAIEQMLTIPVALTIRISSVAMVAAYGILIALLFTLWPLGCALSTSPSALFRDIVSNEKRHASWRFAFVSAIIAVILATLIITTAYEKNFAIWFVIGVSAAWLAFKLMGMLIVGTAGRIGFRRSPVVRLAIANLHRPGAVTSDIVLAVGLGLSVLITTVLVSANLDRQINGMIPEEAPSLFLVGIQSDELNELKGFVERADGVNEFNILPYIPGRITAIKGMSPQQALVDQEGEWLIDDNGERTFSYTAEPLKDVELIEGEWWPADYSGPPLLSIHEDVASSFALTLGDTITMNILGRELVGEVKNIRGLEWRTMRLNFAIMLSPEPLRMIPHSSVATAFIDDDMEYSLQDEIAKSFPAVTVIRVKDALKRVGDLLVQGQKAAQSVSALTIIAGILVLAGIVISENRRRAFETVLLKTVGASRRYVLGAYSLEYLLQGTITAAVAVVVGSAASWAVVSELMGWDWYFLAQPAVNTAILGIVISLVLGLTGVWRALNHRPLYYLRNG